jgi:DNA-binding transcriptional ArsR family regulator
VRADDELGALFAALADPTRRQVVRSLAREPALTASGLAGELPMTRQAVAKHLAALERAGLVAPQREGRELRYRLTPEPLGDAIAWMEDVGARWDRSLARLSERARRG